jgi:hypothetical protein
MAGEVMARVIEKLITSMESNGMVERINGRVADVLKTNRFNSAEDMAHTCTRNVALDSHQFPKSALDSKTSMQTMKDWYANQPDLIRERLYDRLG